MSSLIDLENNSSGLNIEVNTVTALGGFFGPISGNSVIGTPNINLTAPTGFIQAVTPAFTMVLNNAGSNNAINIFNTSNTPNSESLISIFSQASNNSYIRFIQNTIQQWTLGLASVDNKFHISATGTFTTNDVVIIDNNVRLNTPSGNINLITPNVINLTTPSINMDSLNGSTVLNISTNTSIGASSSLINFISNNATSQRFSMFGAVNGSGGGLVDSWFQLFSYNSSTTPIAEVLAIQPQDNITAYAKTYIYGDLTITNDFFINTGGVVYLPSSGSKAICGISIFNGGGTDSVLTTAVTLGAIILTSYVNIGAGLGVTPITTTPSTGVGFSAFGTPLMNYYWFIINGI